MTGSDRTADDVNTAIVFIVGSPRSGTTLFGDVLDLHPQIVNWYEPYFVFDRYFRDHPDDRRTADDAQPHVARYLQREMAFYQRHRGGRIITEKSPRNSLKIPFLRAVFPQARFIHILRDGRDVTLSIRAEWERRAAALRDQRAALPERWRTFRAYLAHQPLLRHKLAAARFQIGSLTNLFGQPQRLAQTTRRWRGHSGWGPQFPGWYDAFTSVSQLEFNAMQWAQCVGTILDDRHLIPDDLFLEIRYETFLQAPQDTLARVFDFIDVDYPPDFDARMPTLNATNFNKWRTRFSADEQAAIAPIVTPLLRQLGYETDDDWHTHA